MTDLDRSLAERLLAAYRKYVSSHGYEASPANWRHGISATPHKVLGWSDFRPTPHAGPSTRLAATAMAEPTLEPVQNPAAQLPIRTVTELTRLVREAVGRSPGLRDVWVEGEVGQVSTSAAGHCYFTLKDEKAQLRCVIFRDDRLMMPFEARTGLRLVAHGRLDVFEPQGVYQLYVESIQPSGFGDLSSNLRR